MTGSCERQQPTPGQGLGESSDEEARYRSVAEELARTVARSNALEARLRRSELELAAARRHLDAADRRRRRLEYRLAVAEWRLESLRRRRWWTIGALSREAIRHPWKLILLPVRILRVVRTPVQPLPRPPEPVRPPSELPIDAIHGELVIPRRPLAALAFVSDGLARLLEHEVELFPATPDNALEKARVSHPNLVIVEAGMAGDALPIEDVMGRQVPSMRWIEDPRAQTEEVVPAAVTVGPGEHDSSADPFEQARGTVQPKIHNPVGGFHRPRDVGIYDFTLGQLDGEPLSSTDPSFPTAVKRFKVIRGVGTPNRAAAPIVATGTPLIIEGVPEVSSLGINAPDPNHGHDMEQDLLSSDLERARRSHPLMRRAIRELSVGRELDRGLMNLGLEASAAALPLIEVMVATNRPHNLDTVFANLARQTYPSLRVILTLHGVEVDHWEVRDRADEAGLEVAIVEVPASVVLGEVFNIGFGETSAEIVAKMDDDDYYGPEYLWDLYSSLDFSGADVAGKWSHYAYLAGRDSTVHRFRHFEHRFNDVVAISTLLMRRRVFDLGRFPSEPFGAGSEFLRDIGREGARVYAADRWNYLYMRSSEGVSNTFPTADVEILAQSTVVLSGPDVSFVTI